MTQNSLFVFCIEIEREMLMQMVEQEKVAGYEPIWECRLKQCVIMQKQLVKLVKLDIAANGIGKEAF